MKKVIRLTESDLHRIIKESVNNILTELDWKTYANAAKSRQEQGNDKSSNDLYYAANKSFRDKYSNGNVFFDDENNAVDNSATVDVNIHKYGADINDNRWDGRDFGSMNSRYTHGEKSPEHTLTQGKSTKGMLKRSNNFNNNLSSMHKDMKNYYGGKSQYIKGKGWSE